jgi:hypothetical protein
MGVSYAEIIALAAVAVGGALGYAFVARRRSVKQFFVLLVSYFLLATVAGFSAALMVAAGEDPVAPAVVLRHL